MATVAVTILAGRDPGGHKHAVIKCAGRRLTLAITSPTVDHSSLTGDWKQQPRPLDKPLIGMAGLQLETAKVTCTLANADGSSVETDLRTLIRFSRDPDHHVTLANYGGLAAGPWHITDMSVSSDRRRFGTNTITRAQVMLTLTEAVPDPNPKATKKKPANGDGKPHTYVVRAGDTLSSLAVRFYGHANEWRKIAKANGLRNAKVKVGQKLKIPA